MSGIDGMDGTASATESIGQLLARLRAARGLDVAKAAQDLRCDRAVIEALESDRYADLGAAVFARGHLRRYADFLGAPSAELLARWSAEQAGGQPLPDLTRAPQAPRPLDTRRWGRLLAVIAGALAIGLAAWWILQGAGARPAPAADARAAVAPAVATPSQALPVPEVAPLPQGTAETATADISAAATPPVAEPADRPADPVVETPARAAGPGEIAMSFIVQADCWAEVSDAEGGRRLYQTIRAGQRVTATGKPPLRVTLGRGDVTQLEIDGRATIIPPDAVRNAVARFEVTASGALRALPPVPAPAAAAPAVAPAGVPP